MPYYLMHFESTGGSDTKIRIDQRILPNLNIEGGNKHSDSATGEVESKPGEVSPKDVEVFRVCYTAS